MLSIKYLIYLIRSNWTVIFSTILAHDKVVHLPHCFSSSSTGNLLKLDIMNEEAIDPECLPPVLL